MKHRKRKCGVMFESLEQKRHHNVFVLVIIAPTVHFDDTILHMAKPFLALSL